MNRHEKILHHINLNGYGLEIGPSFNPIAPKKDGYKVHILDHMNREQLITKYRDHNVHLENIEEVDFVWAGEDYSELTGKTNYYDWIIASHLIEHTPDLIGFLNGCDAVLKEDGVISLVVPDKRYCFDHYRPITGISRIIDGHIHKNRTHSPGTAAEYYLGITSKGGEIAWDSTATGQYNFVHSLEDALQGMERALHNVYLDLHAWCFVPHSFRLIIHDLYQLGLIRLQEVDYLPTEGCEFFITLSRNGKGIDKSRLEMLDLIEAELREGIPAPPNAEDQFQRLTALLAEKDHRLAESEQTTRSLSAQLAESEQAVQTLTTQLGVLQTTAQTQLAKRDAQIHEIIDSKAWKLALLFRRIRVLIVPPNSLRARLARQLLSFFSSKKQT